MFKWWDPQMLREFARREAHRLIVKAISSLVIAIIGFIFYRASHLTTPTFEQQQSPRSEHRQVDAVPVAAGRSEIELRAAETRLRNQSQIAARQNKPDATIDRELDAVSNELKRLKESRQNSK